MDEIDQMKITTLELDSIAGELEVILSTDGKNTVRLVTGKNKTVEVEKAIALYNLLREMYGTKAETDRKAYSAATPPQNADDPSYCPVHKEYMKKYAKNGKSWFSHNVEGTWCNGGRART